MAKIIYAIMIVLFVEFAMFLFAGTTYAKTSLLSMILDPSAITSTVFYVAIFAILATFAGSVIVSGNFYNINIYALYSAMIVIFIGFIQTLVHLYVFIGSSLQTSLTPEMIQVIQVIFLGPLLIFYLVACLEWIRGNQ